VATDSGTHWLAAWVSRMHNGRFDGLPVTAPSLRDLWHAAGEQDIADAALYRAAPTPQRGAGVRYRVPRWMLFGPNGRAVEQLLALSTALTPRELGRLAEHPDAWPRVRDDASAAVAGRLVDDRPDLDQLRALVMRRGAIGHEPASLVAGAAWALAWRELLPVGLFERAYRPWREVIGAPRVGAGEAGADD
jgi:hypothetical protein